MESWTFIRVLLSSTFKLMAIIYNTSKISTFYYILYQKNILLVEAEKKRIKRTGNRFHVCSKQTVTKLDFCAKYIIHGESNHASRLKPWKFGGDLTLPAPSELA